MTVYKLNYSVFYPSRLLPFLKISLSLLLTILAFACKAIEYPVLNPDQFNWLGQQIYKNECNQQASCITSWNAGENFPSLGIGHFIWYQSGQEEIFEESFPLLMEFLQSRTIEIPHWIIEENFNSPWTTREEFIESYDKPRQTELRLFLLQHIPEQTQFIVHRFDQALNKIILESPDSDNVMLEDRFLEIANTSIPYGLYALIDYVNFKGEGISSLEQYNGQGWGLKQVLENMRANQADPLQEFVYSARNILSIRVNNSPQERNEKRWLQGWENRLNTYLPPSEKHPE